MSPEDPQDQGGPADRGTRLAARRAALSAEDRALLEQRLRARGPKSSMAAPVSLVPLQPAGSRPPFFCVHPAGGDVLCFQALAQHMGQDQPFYGLQSRGLGPGESALGSLEEMAAGYREEIAAVTSGPYYLGGWSLGGALVYELGRQIASAGGEVRLLAVIDSTPGPWPRPEVEDGNATGPRGEAVASDDDDTPWLLEMADYLERLWGIRLGLTAENLRGLSTEEQALRFLAGLKDTPFGAKGGPDSLRRLLTVFKSNVSAFRRYRPEPYPGTITLFRPALESEAEEHPAALADPTLGWGALSPLPVALESVSGDHISALAEPHVRQLAERLRTLIDHPPGLPPAGETRSR